MVEGLSLRGTVASISLAEHSLGVGLKTVV
jgi:hypothetical protein